MRVTSLRHRASGESDAERCRYGETAEVEIGEDTRVHHLLSHQLTRPPFPFQLGRDPVVRLPQVGPNLLYMDGKKPPDQKPDNNCTMEHVGKSSSSSC